MKKVSFEELCDMVAHVDYLWEDTFPIYFKVDNTEYIVGIGNYDCGDDTGDDYGVFGITEELQYLARFEPDVDSEGDTIYIPRYLDVDDPDKMVYGEIVEMLRKQCNITEDSEIGIFEDESFNGSQDYTVEWVFCTEDAQNKALKEYEDWKNSSDYQDYLEVERELEEIK